MELQRLTAEIVDLMRSGARPQDIAVVTLAGLSVSQVMKQAMLGTQRLVRADSDDLDKHIVADTFLRMKGLERPFVIVVEVAAGHASEYERRMHIAATRAMSRLTILATADDVARDARLAGVE
jgi:DNA helicase IV